MEAKIKELISSLSQKMGKPEIISIVYNPHLGGMTWEDCKFLKLLLESKNYNAPLLVLSGHGGNFEAGILFPHILRDKIKTYKVYVPSVCGSALCYTIFRAQELFVGDKTKITQIDPLFEEGEQWLRAISIMYNSEHRLQKKAKEVFHLVRDQLVDLCNNSSLFCSKYVCPEEFYHREHLQEIFMKKDEHDSPVTKKELEELEIRHSPVENPEIEETAHALIQVCQDYTIQNDVRVIFVSSKPLNFNSREDGELEGEFICPLK